MLNFLEDPTNSSDLFWRNEYGDESFRFSSYAAYIAGVGALWESYNSPAFSPIVDNAWTLGTRSAPSAVPEIDPAMGGSALSLVAGVLAMIEQRRRRGLASALTA